MVQIKKIVGIRKREYNFELRRRYYNRRKFRIVEKKPVEMVKEALMEVLFPKKPGASDIRKPLIAFGVFLLVLILAATLLISSSTKPPAPANISYTAPLLSADFTEGGIASTGGRVLDSVVGYYTLNYSVSGADSIAVTTSAYDRRVPSQVFVLTGRMDQATTYPRFRYLLAKSLEEKGLAVNEISPDQVETLPAGALLVIPSGLIPEKLTQPGGANLLSLLNRSVDVLYIGQRFDGQGFVISDSGARKSVDAEFAAKIPFVFTPANLNSNGSLRMLSTYYSASPYERGRTALLYGTISMVNTAGGGTMLFVPQVLDHGWEKPEYAAQDVDKIITEMLWVSPQSQETVRIPVAGNSSSYSFFYSAPFSERQKTIVARVVASKEGSKTERLAVFYVRKKVNGDLFYTENTDRLVSGSITEKDTAFIASLRENSSEERRLFMAVRDVNGRELSRAPIAPGASGMVPLLGDTEFYDRVNLGEGVYLASIIDEAGNEYAYMIIKVVDVNISLVSQNFDRSTFLFAASADGQPVKIKQLKLTVDGKYNYYFTDSPRFAIDMQADLRGDVLPAGNHTFYFEYSGKNSTIVLQRAVSSQFYENPLYWVLGFIALLLFIGAPYVAAVLHKEEYALDIPDFPPLSAIKIPVKSETVSGIMEKINEDYKWKDTPLTLEELKKGFKNIIYQNKPVFISDYNLEYILDRLHDKGMVKGALDYYGLAKWEQDTGRSIKYLAMQRKIRDICINEAIPFSKGKEKVKCDTYLKVLGQDVFVYIMDSPLVREEKLSLALKAIQKGMVVLLFANPEEKKDFEDTTNSASEGAGLVKLEMMAGSLALLEMKEFEKMLREMKNV